MALRSFTVTISTNIDRCIYKDTCTHTHAYVYAYINTCSCNRVALAFAYALRGLCAKGAGEHSQFPLYKNAFRFAGAKCLLKATWRCVGPF